MKVFVTGATGLLGRALTKALIDGGHQVVALSRNGARAASALPAEVQVVEGDPVYEGEWQSALAGCDVVVGLAGQSMDGRRWNLRYKQLLHDSRVDSTRFLVEAMAALDESQRPSRFVSTSGIDYYGFAEFEKFDDDEFDETAPMGETFLSRLCHDWEGEAREAEALGVEVAIMRTGVVLAHEGALSKLALPFRFGVGGRLGSGRQWMSWIHIDDVVGAFLFAIEGKIRGPVNVVAPGTRRNGEIARALGKVMRRPSILPAPAFAVRWVAGEIAEYVLKGRQAIPTALLKAGYDFRYPELEEALEDLLG